MRRKLLLVVLGLYVLLLLDMTQRWFPENHPPPNLLPFRSMVRDIRHGGWDFRVNFLGNLVAFLPLGIMPPLIDLRWDSLRRITLAAATFSAAIELCQFLSGRRVADVDDVLLNTVGAILGLLAYRSIRAMAARRSGV